MRGSCLLAACGMLFTGPIFTAQAPDPRIQPYTDAVHRYQRGDLTGAATELTDWSQRDLVEMGAVVLERRDWQLVEAAAMLHTEMVGGDILANPGRASRQLALAETRCNELDESPPTGTMPFDT